MLSTFNNSKYPVFAKGMSTGEEKDILLYEAPKVSSSQSKLRKLQIFLKFVSLTIVLDVGVIMNSLSCR